MLVTKANSENTAVGRTLSVGGGGAAQLTSVACSFSCGSHCFTRWSVPSLVWSTALYTNLHTTSKALYYPQPKQGKKNLPLNSRARAASPCAVTKLPNEDKQLTQNIICHPFYLFNQSVLFSMLFVIFFHLFHLFLPSMLLRKPMSKTNEVAAA